MKAAAVLSSLAALAVVSAESCAPPGATAASGDVGCDPAKDYPNEACALIGDCHYLRGLGAIVPTSTGGAQPTPTASCPPAGETNAAGDYSCNPAHDYSAQQQACALIGDCYFLRGLGVNPTQGSMTQAPWPSHTIVVAGAGRLQAAGGLAAAAFGVVYLLL